MLWGSRRADRRLDSITTTGLPFYGPGLGGPFGWRRGWGLLGWGLLCLCTSAPVRGDVQGWGGGTWVVELACWAASPLRAVCAPRPF